MFESRCAEHFCEFKMSKEMIIFYRTNTVGYDCLDMGNDNFVVFEFVLN